MVLVASHNLMVGEICHAIKFSCKYNYMKYQNHGKIMLYYYDMGKNENKHSQMYCGVNAYSINHLFCLLVKLCYFSRYKLSFRESIQIGLVNKSTPVRNTR